MRNMSSKIQKTVATTLLLSASVAFGVEKNADLLLKVTGNISGNPTWTDEAGSPISEVTFSFSGVQLAASSDRDSSIHTVKLGNMQSSQPNVQVIAPSGCKIGVTDIAQNDVLLLVNDAPKSDGDVIDFSGFPSAKLQLRFSGAGGYGDKTGNVTCNTGKLRYTYEDGTPTT